MNEWGSGASLVYLLTLGSVSKLLISVRRPLSLILAFHWFVWGPRDGPRWGSEMMVAAWGRSIRRFLQGSERYRDWRCKIERGWRLSRKVFLAEGLSRPEAQEKAWEWKYKGSWDQAEGEAEQWGRGCEMGHEEEAQAGRSMKVRHGRTRRSSHGIWTYLLEKKSRSDIWRRGVVHRDSEKKRNFSTSACNDATRDLRATWLTRSLESPQMGSEQGLQGIQKHGGTYKIDPSIDSSGWITCYVRNGCKWTKMIYAFSLG